MSAARPDPGPLAEEAARLVEAAAQWARRAAADLPGDTGAPECAVCPFCRAVRALRDEHPDVVERAGAMATEAAAAVAAVLRTLFDGHAASTPPASQPGVQHIDLS
ncbi:MAG TPA: hypothetical protein VGD72_08230 [Mycobacteriales bacterium]|jgi:hypothetical protein